jgi:hypothetical protein
LGAFVYSIIASDNTPMSNFATGIAIDKNRAGDVHYVVGETFGSMDGNPNLGGYDAFSAQFDQFGNRLLKKTEKSLSGPKAFP